MAMGIVTDEDFESQAEKLIPDYKKVPVVPPQVEIEDIKRGRGEGRVEVPEIVRESVARAAIEGGQSGADIANAFNVSESSVSAYKVGATSTTNYHKPDENLLSVVTGHRQSISKRARGTLLSALDILTPDKLEKAKARELASIARDMSSIIVDMEPPLPPIQQNQNNVQFVFMAPRVKNEESYSIIEVPD